MAGTDDTVETELSENDEFCTLQVRSKRGSGTRDEDRVKATLARDSLEAIEEDREEFLAMVEDTLAEARDWQPDEDDDE